VIEYTAVGLTNAPNYAYDYSMTINGAVREAFPGLVHFQYTRFRLAYWADAAAAGEPHVAFDAAKLMFSKAVPNYDPDLIGNVVETKEAAYIAEVAHPPVFFHESNLICPLS
jgi:hypothetical protein